MKWTKNPWVWLTLFLLVTTLLVVWLNNRFPGALASREGQIDLTRSLLILAVVGGSFILHRRMAMNNVLRNLSLWTGIAGVVFIAYSFRDEAAGLGIRLMSEINPGAGQNSGDEIRFPKSSNGHFVVETWISGEPVRFLVDTGATDIVLSPRDAERLGFDLSSLQYSKVYNTANGQVQGAPVELSQLQLGPIYMENVRATVNGADMNQSLLGMSFLNRLSAYSVSGDYLVLKP